MLHSVGTRDENSATLLYDTSLNSLNLSRIDCKLFQTARDVELCFNFVVSHCHETGLEIDKMDTLRT